MIKILIVAGTRPEIIKISPIILKRNPILIIQSKSNYALQVNTNLWLKRLC